MTVLVSLENGFVEVQAPILCGSAEVALGADQGPLEPTMVFGSQPRPLGAD